MLGLAYWQLFNGNKNPFAHITSPRDLLQEMNAALANARDATAELGQCENMPSFMNDLITRMCSLSIEHRPSAIEVCDILAEHVPNDMHLFASAYSEAEPSINGFDAFSLEAVIAGRSNENDSRPRSARVSSTEEV